jgi:SAM-dependent methyltransferase
VVIDERLDEGAPVQLRLSAAHCATGCAWYHGPRQYLRALNVVPGIGRDSAYFAETLERLAREQRFTRVLISGSADCGILAHVVAAYAAAGVPLAVTLVDRCRTPLGINEWYAALQGVPIEVHQAEIGDFEPAAPFDVVCTHGFLGWFEPAARQQIVATWRRLLRPGGVVLTASSVRQAVGLTDSEVKAFRERGRQAHAEANRRFGLDAETIDRWADRYARRTTHYMPVSVADVEQAFLDEGFTFRELVTAPGRSSSDFDRIRVVAERRGSGPAERRDR